MLDQQRALLGRGEQRVDELQVVVAKQVRLRELHDRAWARGVQRDRQPELAGGVPVALGLLDRQHAARGAADAHGADVARADAHREQAVARHPIFLYARDAGEIHRLVVRHALRGAVGEAAADAGVAHGGKLAVGVIRRADVMRPVVHRCAAGAQRLGGAEDDGAVAVLRRHELAQAVAHREIAELVDVGPDERPEQAGPEMPMGVDEARHADHAAAFDDLRLRRVDLRRDRDDRAVAHMHVAGREIVDLGVHGQHGGAADHELAARRQRCAGAFCGPRRRRLREQSMRRSKQRTQRGGALEDRPPAHRMLRHRQPPLLVYLARLFGRCRSA